LFKYVLSIDDIKRAHQINDIQESQARNTKCRLRTWKPQLC